jgi:hypothetical protein
MSIWQDVSYRHKSGVWELNIHTGEEREVKPQEVHIHEGWGTPTEENKIKPATTLPADEVVPLEEHVVIKPARKKFPPKTDWK